MQVNPASKELAVNSNNSMTKLRLTLSSLINERKQIRDCDQISFDALQAHIESAEAHRKDIFVKELVNWIAEPVGETSISHPFELQDICGNEGQDNVKNDAKLLALVMMMHWTWTLHDWCAQQFAKSEEKDSDVAWPIVPDADDIMLEPDVVLRIVEGKTSKGLVLDDEVRKWKVDFGEEERANIEKWVRDAIPD
ncbi:uncharacterized protein K444DRAFT_666901 [Hyaloscypha bicolor E]|uniref:Uncharacterized protein n=1 Tax=Hyaloscypha bicolor E TaxID=1095630 RepID=A0A2J6SW14_9HELO|nr:uncharacterized protein K444DRAFT_666901 [Hyaloscypha bicolor E]PMD54964.1 hypothetical protein K444DRAFT_666901 [Hyaloscypha bicolor E]